MKRSSQFFADEPDGGSGEIKKRKTQGLSGLGTQMKKPQHLGSWVWLLHMPGQGVKVTVHSSTKRWACGIQLDQVGRLS